MRTRVPVLSLALMVLFPLAALARTTGMPKLSPGNSKLVRIPGHVLPALAKATAIEARPSDSKQPMTLTIVLKRDDQAGFDRYLKEINDPHSKNFRRFLKQREIARRFGPSQHAYDSTLAYLRAHGFKLEEGSKNRLTLTVRGRRSDVVRAFDVAMGDYRLGDQQFYSNDRDPGLPAELARHVLAVTGLSSYSAPKATAELSDLVTALTCLLVGGIQAAVKLTRDPKYCSANEQGQTTEQCKQALLKYKINKCKTQNARAAATER